MQRAALAAGPGLLVSVEGVEQRRQVLYDISDGDLDAMQERLTAHAIPFEAVFYAGQARALDDEPDGAGDGPLR